MSDNREIVEICTFYRRVVLTKENIADYAVTSYKAPPDFEEKYFANVSAWQGSTNLSEIKVGDTLLWLIDPQGVPYSERFTVDRLSSCKPSSMEAVREWNERPSS